jgi:predicted metal-dependent RNase
LNGEFTGPYPPYGYTKHQENKHILIINPEQSEIVRKIYNLFIAGNSIYKIAKILKQDEILTPRAEMFLSHGTYESVQIGQYPFDWSNKTILNILENEEYTGSVICNRHQTISFKSKKLIKNPSNKWIVSKNMHEPIINSEMYMQVQDIIHQNKKAPRKNIQIFLKVKLDVTRVGRH